MLEPVIDEGLFRLAVTIDTQSAALRQYPDLVQINAVLGQEFFIIVSVKEIKMSGKFSVVIKFHWFGVKVTVYAVLSFEFESPVLQPVVADLVVAQHVVIDLGVVLTVEAPVVPQKRELRRTLVVVVHGC